MTESPITLIAPKGRVVSSMTYFVEAAEETSSAAVVRWAAVVIIATAKKTKRPRFDIRAMYLHDVAECWRDCSG
ncbi:MAG: hypothetical protein ACO35F_10980, partial [Ilumatobacteraceae bacterium]